MSEFAWCDRNDRPLQEHKLAVFYRLITGFVDNVLVNLHYAEVNQLQFQFINTL